MGVYKDGAMRDDVMAYLKSQYIPELRKLESLMPSYHGDSCDEISYPDIGQSEAFHHLVVHDESTFSNKSSFIPSWIASVMS